MLQRGGHQEAAAGQRREAAGDAPGAAEEGAGGNGYAGPYGSAGSKTGAKDKGLSTPPEKIQQTEAPPVQTSPLLDDLRGLLARRDDLAQELAKIDVQLDEMRRMLNVKG